MRCTLYVDFDVVKDEKLIPYKYAILTPSRHRYEWFHEKNELTDRCLIVPHDCCKPKGMVLLLLVLHDVLMSK